MDLLVYKATREVGGLRILAPFNSWITEALSLAQGHGVG